MVLLATYAALFARPLSRTRRILTWLTYLAGGFSALVSITGIAGEWIGRIDTHTSIFSQLPWVAVIGPGQNPATSIPSNLAAMLALVCAVMALNEARGAERNVLAWATASIGLFYVLNVVSTLLEALNISVIGGFLLTNIAEFILPLGLSYSILNKRLLDVGFALNRATVFTLVSLVVLGAFTLAEWALGGWLHSANKVTNVAVSAGLALLLGLSIHPIHSRVDRFVDNVFFRKRHDDEKALQRFAHEATFMTDGDVMIERERGYSKVIRALRL